VILFSTQNGFTLWGWWFQLDFFTKIIYLINIIEMQRIGVIFQPIKIWVILPETHPKFLFALWEKSLGAMLKTLGV
jgi:hypothetical protein